MLFFYSSTSSWGDNINRGLFKTKLANGNVRLLVIGDSITNPYVTDRLVKGMCKNWQVNLFGAMAGFIAQGDSGWPISNYPASGTNISQNLGPAGAGIRPGDAFYDGTTGHNLSRTIPYNYTGDYTNQGTVGQGIFYKNNAYNVDWDQNQTLKAKLLLRTAVNAPTDHRLWGRARGASSQADAGNITYNATLSAPSFQVYTHTFSRGSGTVATTYTQLRSFTATEISGWHVDNIAMSVELNTPPANNGMFIGYAGEGGYTTKSHTAAGEVINVGGFGAYNTYYSDEALDAHLQAFSFDTFFIYLGQNPAADEDPGQGTIGAYKANIEAIISRYKTRCAANGITNPTFILCSIYPTSSDNTRSTNIAAALREIALADPAIEFYDLRKYIVATYGNYSTWQATYCPDLYHPNLAFTNIITNWLWSQY